MDILVDVEALESFSASVFVDAGCREEDAVIAARSLVTADLRGVHTHGVRRLGGYVVALERRVLKACPTPTVVRDTNETVRWDGDSGLGQIVAHRVITNAIERTRSGRSRITMAVAGNSGHIGAVGYWALLCAQQGLIGIAVSNTPAIAAAPGGRTNVIGNGPFAWAVPATTRTPPVVFDVSWTRMSGSAVIEAEARGDKLSEAAVLDHEGHPTRDPSAYRAGGTLRFVGDHKGYGMALFAEVLASMLGGGAPAYTLAPDVVGFSFAFIVVDPEAFLQRAELDERIDELSAVIRESALVPGSTRVLLPGEAAAERVASARKHGLRLPASAWEQLFEFAERTGRHLDLLTTRL